MQEKLQKDYSFLIEQIKRTRALGATLVKLQITSGHKFLDIPALTITRGPRVANNTFSLKDSKDYVERLDDIGLFKKGDSHK